MFAILIVVEVSQVCIFVKTSNYTSYKRAVYCVCASHISVVMKMTGTVSKRIAGPLALPFPPSPTSVCLDGGGGGRALARKGHSVSSAPRPPLCNWKGRRQQGKPWECPLAAPFSGAA